MTEQRLAEFAALIKTRARFCLIGHTAPDGDCLMAAMALSSYLRQAGKEADLALEGRIPYNYDLYFDPSRRLEITPEEPYEVAVALDCATPARLGGYLGLFERARIGVVIDHHVTNRGFGDLAIVEPRASSTCEIIFRLLEGLGHTPDLKTAEYLYIGIMTDTGKFRYPGLRGDTHRTLGALLDLGVRPDLMYKHIFRDKPAGLARACGRGMAELSLHAGGAVALTAITRQTAELNGGRIDEIDGLIDWLMDIRGVRVACVLKEQGPRLTKVSLRGENGCDFSELALRHRGGGHPNAAGFSLPLGWAEAKNLMIEELSELIRATDHDPAERREPAQP